MLFYLWTLDVEHVARTHDLLTTEQQGPLVRIGKERLHIEERLADRYLQQRGRLSIGKRNLHVQGSDLSGARPECSATSAKIELSARSLSASVCR